MIYLEDWIAELEAKRAACYSTVTVVETNDDRRYQEYLSHRREECEGSETLVWDTFDGLTMYAMDRADKVQGTGLLYGEIEYVCKYLMERSKGKEQKKRVVIIKNVLTSQDLPMKALNTWGMDDLMFGEGNSVVVFVPDRSIMAPKVLEKCIFISPPYSTPREREALLNLVLKEARSKGALGKDALKHQAGMVEATSGLNLSQTEAVFWETVYDYALNAKEFLGIDVITRAKADIINRSSGLKIRKDLKHGFERIGGYDPLKDYVRQNIILPLKDPQRAKDLGMELPRGLILFGPGGTGKTVFAKALAKEVGLPFCTLSPEDFMNAYVGESENRLRSIIKLAEEMAPIIIFIDEIDRLGGRGDGKESDGGTSKRLFSMFLEWLGSEERQSFIIGATNMPYMDAAFRREGRFDCIVPMLSPDLEARAEILNVHLNVVRSVKHEIGSPAIHDIAVKTEGWKGNMLEELVKRAVRQAFTDGSECVGIKHLLAAFEDYQVNQTTLREDEEKYITMAKELCNSKRFIEELLGTGQAADPRMQALRGGRK